MVEKSPVVTVEPGTIAVARIVALTGTGRNATDTRNVLIIRELALGVSQSAIVNATDAAGEKLDKGTVSRLNTQLKSLKPGQKKLILQLDPESIDPSLASTWTDALRLAASIRPGKLQAAPRTPKGKEATDPHAAFYDYLFEPDAEGNPVFHADRWELMQAAVAAGVAELDAQQEAVAA